MRIIAGERKGFPLVAPHGGATRPTLGRVRESLFSIVAPFIAGAHVADVFAGAGGLGLEALSRGAERCVFVEKSRAALEALRKNIDKLDYRDRCNIVSTDALRWLGAARPDKPFDIVFLDPPYNTGALQKSVELLAASRLLAPGAVVVAQAAKRDHIDTNHGERLALSRSANYGDTTLHFFDVLNQQ